MTLRMGNGAGLKVAEHKQAAGSGAPLQSRRRFTSNVTVNHLGGIAA
jgi:hypothetical protein